MPNHSTDPNVAPDIDNSNFQYVIQDIKQSNTYENADHWESRGLNPSDDEVVQALKKTTHIFLDDLLTINEANITLDDKHKQVTDLVDKLPWDEFDTEEKEFLADTLAPAINAMGFDAWSIF